MHWEVRRLLSVPYAEEMSKVSFRADKFNLRVVQYLIESEEKKI